MSESKAKRRERFVKLAEKRVNRTIKDLRLIGKLANRTNYVYSEEDVRKIFRALENELKTARARFESNGQDPEPQFTLRD